MRVRHVFTKDRKVLLIVEHEDWVVQAVTLTEEQWDELEAERIKIMRPIWEARSREARRASEAEDDRKRRAAQRVVDIDGYRVRIQRHWHIGGGGHEISAYLDGFEAEVAPFYVSRLGMSVLRPWGIEGKIARRRRDGWPIREEVYGAKGGTLRFESLEAAVSKALELGLQNQEASAP